MSERTKDRLILWLVLGLAVLINAAGFDGYHFIAITALVFALDTQKGAA